MKLPSIIKFTFVLVGALFVAGTVNPADAQDLFLKDQIGDFGDAPTAEDPVTMSADFQLKTDTRSGILNVRAKIDPAWHIFAMKKTKGPMPSKISVAESKDYKLVGDFKPDRKPHEVDEEGFEEPCLEFEDSVTWSAPIELAENVDPKNLTIEIVYNGQTCESKPYGSCRPLTFDLSGKFAGYDDTLKVAAAFQQKPVEIKEFEIDKSHLKVKARLVRAAGTNAPIRPGDIVNFELTGIPQGKFHVYDYTLEKVDYLPTLIGFVETNGWPVTGPKVSKKPVDGEDISGPVKYHDEPVTWTFQIAIPKSAEANKSYPFRAAIGVLTCDDGGCDLPAGATFTADIPLGSAAIIPVKYANAGYDVAQKAIKSGGAAKPLGAVDSDSKQDSKVDQAEDKVDQEEPVAASTPDSPEKLEEMLSYYDADKKINYETLNNAAKATFWTAIFGAFVGGMLLNLMPCVFPVLGLKVMGFVSQAGSEPRKIRNHGIAFTLGLVVSMWVLAGFILVLKLSFGQSVNWGQQMGNPYFVAGIIVLLFLLGLNMAGVFEIGTSLTSVGSSAQKKGYTGSFFSGILTTLIATPCSGPFLGAAMGYTLAQPPGIAIFLFTVFALGIASPYLVLSFFPSLIAKLPRPGAWMETFKITMAFALFATVAFFARTFGAQTGVRGLSWLVMALVVIGLAMFIYGQWSPSEVKAGRRFVIGYGLAGLILALGGYMSYDAARQEGEIVSHGEWESWAPGKVEYTLAQENPIIWVDYTADW